MSTNRPIQPQNNKLQQQRSLGSRSWIALSLIVSACILLWTFSLPFRLSGSSLAKSNDVTPSSESLDLVDRVKRKRSAAEQYRQAAIAMDREFMRSVAQKRERRQALPGRAEARSHWKRRRDRIEREIRELGNPKESTAQWHYLQELKSQLDSDEDAPLQ